RFLLLVSYRPEYRHNWSNRTYYAQVRIDPLSPSMTRAMLDGLLGTNIELEEFKRFLLSRTEGKPFFLEELVRAFVETGALSGKHGAYRVTGSISDPRIPATLESLLASRVDRLSSSDKRLLQAAVVIGEPVPLGILQAVATFSL